MTAFPSASEVSDKLRTGVTALCIECMCSTDLGKGSSAEFLLSVWFVVLGRKKNRLAVFAPMKRATPTAAPNANCVTDPMTERNL